MVHVDFGCVILIKIVKLKKRKEKSQITYQVYSEWVTTQLKENTRKQRLYRLADQWRKFKVGTVQ